MEIPLIGTSHIARQSIRDIRQAFRDLKPDIVAVELDMQRARTLLENHPKRLPWSQMPLFGIKGFVFAKLGQYVQQKLGKIVGVSPGSDMKTALELARAQQVQIALIDQPLQVTLRRLSANITWREKGRFLLDIIKGIFFPRRQLRLLGLEKLDLRQVPEKEVINKAMEQLQQGYPSVYRVLVEERNRYMVRQLVKLVREHPGKKILAVVGAGHEEGMRELLGKVDVVAS